MKAIAFALLAAGGALLGQRAQAQAGDPATPASPKRRAPAPVKSKAHPVRAKPRKRSPAKPHPHPSSVAPQTTAAPPPSPPEPPERRGAAPAVPPSPEPAPLEPPVPEAPPEAAEAPDESRVSFTAHGFLTSRLLVEDDERRAAFYALFPSSPSPRGYGEFDLQPRLRVDGQRFGAAGDFSLYVATDEPQHLVLINEAYVESQVAGPLYLLAGRRRVVWGSGIAFNPTDLLNPPKNPLDIEQQRTGAFLLPLLELTTHWFTLSGAVSPQVATTAWALPNQLDFTKLKAAGRAYFLVLKTDVNFIYFYDLGLHRNYGGLSLSRYFGDKLELHAEGLLAQGPAGAVLPAVPMCGSTPTSPFQKANGSLIAGGRLDLSDLSFLAAEYLFNGSGLDSLGFNLLKDELPCLSSALSAIALAQPNPVGHPLDPSLIPLRQHYAVLIYQRPHLGTDWLEPVSLGGAAVVSIAGGSVLLQLRLGYKFGDSASFGLTGVARLGVNGTELEMDPQRWLAYADLRLVY